MNSVQSTFPVALFISIVCAFRVQNKLALRLSVMLRIINRAFLNTEFTLKGKSIAVHIGGINIYCREWKLTLNKLIIIVNNIS